VEEKCIKQRGVEEAHENGKESSNLHMIMEWMNETVRCYFTAIIIGVRIK
jgi:hypothetical protein